MNKQLIIIGIVTLLVCIGLSGCSETKELLPGPLYVGYGSDADFQSIQAAIDAAQNGATIYVQKGSYDERINVSKTIILIGEDKNTTIINFSPNHPISQVPILSINANNCTIENLQITKGNRSLLVQGISINSKNNTIKNMIITNFTNGITLLAYSALNTILYNKITNNQIGLDVTGSTSNTISQNIFSNNSQYNIYFKTDSDTNIISYNIINSSFYGIRIKGSHHNLVNKNCIKNNDVGIYFCCGSKLNEFYNNTLLNNFQGNAEEDKGLNNIWNDASNHIGNYWDNYTGSDGNNDGIGDIPCKIPRAGNQDSYPLMAPPLDVPCNQ